MENRKTKVIEIPIDKQKIEIKTYLTAREEQEIQKVLYDAAEISSGIVADMKGSKGEVMLNMERKLMEMSVVSIDGNNENIVEKLLDMRNTDYDFIKEEIDKIRLSEEVKKK